MSRKSPSVVGLSEAAELLGIRAANVRKFLARRPGVVATELKVGPIWWRRDIERVKREWNAEK